MNFYFKLKSSKGFTLIELLVVIAIIGLLSSVVLASLNSARAKARDASRISGIHQLQNALDLYYSQYNHYPISLGGVCTAQGAYPPGWCDSRPSSVVSGHWIWDSSNSLSLQGLIATDPVDPVQSSSNTWLGSNPRSYYYYSNDGTWYMIVYGLEKYPSSLENTDGVTATYGVSYDYGAQYSIPGILTVGRGK